jgi:ABC-type multidrug transport system permease subunit
MVQMLIEIPYCLIQSILFSLLTYSMMSLAWTAKKFFYYTFIMYFTLLYFTYYGMMAVALTPNHQVAAIVSSGFYSIFNLFSGFMIFRHVSKLSSSLYGGCGTTGRVLWLGRCMDSLQRNLET